MGHRRVKHVVVAIRVIDEASDHRGLASYIDLVREAMRWRPVGWLYAVQASLSRVAAGSQDSEKHLKGSSWTVIILRVDEGVSSFSHGLEASDR